MKLILYVLCVQQLILVLKTDFSNIKENISMKEFKKLISERKTYLGIEFGSTRIKILLINENHKIIAAGSHTWENKLRNGVWTYSLGDTWKGLQECYADLASTVEDKYGKQLTTFGGIGISAMMHGYMAFDSDDNMLVPFRTWRNTITGEAAEKLTELFGFNIPQRWSIAHLYQAILNQEPHVKDINYLTTLAGYIHWQLTGEKALGIGDASGMFPINDDTRKYDKAMIDKFNSLNCFNRKLNDILPEILMAGENAGTLTEKGAKLLDPSGTLKAGIPICPPEGDAGTGMTATNAVRQKTGNVSAGTSVFAMVVLEKALSKVYPQIDMVTTPSGDAVAMVHCNNCTGDLDAWVNLIGEAARLLDAEFDMNTLYAKLYSSAMQGDKACGGLLSYNYISGEHITGAEEGRPMFVRKPDAEFTLSNFMRTHLYSSCASLKIGMNILLNNEGVALESITGHGGFFKQAYEGQRIMSSALNATVNVMGTAGDGGPWGMSVLAAYMINKKNESLADYLSDKVFADVRVSSIEPQKEDVEGFNRFLEQYQSSIVVEKAVAKTFK